MLNLCYALCCYMSHCNKEQKRRITKIPTALQSWLLVHPEYGASLLWMTRWELSVFQERWTLHKPQNMPQFSGKCQAVDSHCKCLSQHILIVHLPEYHCDIKEMMDTLSADKEINFSWIILPKIDALWAFNDHLFELHLSPLVSDNLLVIMRAKHFGKLNYIDLCSILCFVSVLNTVFTSFLIDSIF